MHALDWLNERGRILRGAIQPIASVHFYRSRFRSRFRSRYRGLCDRAFIIARLVEHRHVNPEVVGSNPTLQTFLCSRFCSVTLFVHFTHLHL